MLFIMIMIYPVGKNWNHSVVFRFDSGRDDPADFMVQTQGRSSCRSLTSGPG